MSARLRAIATSAARRRIVDSNCPSNRDDLILFSACISKAPHGFRDKSAEDFGIRSIDREADGYERTKAGLGARSGYPRPGRDRRRGGWVHDLARLATGQRVSERFVNDLLRQCRGLQRWARPSAPVDRLLESRALGHRDPRCRGVGIRPSGIEFDAVIRDGDEHRQTASPADAVWSRGDLPAVFAWTNPTDTSAAAPAQTPVSIRAALRPRERML